MSEAIGGMGFFVVVCKGATGKDSLCGLEGDRVSTIWMKEGVGMEARMGLGTSIVVVELLGTLGFG